MTPMTATTAAKTGARTAGIILAVHCVPLLSTIVGLVTAIVLAVALPAIWSAKPARRAAALDVLTVILMSVSGPAVTADSEVVAAGR